MKLVLSGSFRNSESPREAISCSNRGYPDQAALHRKLCTINEQQSYMNQKKSKAVASLLE
jgi:hypothetical protein